MARKHRKQLNRLITPSLLVGLFVVCGASLGSQVVSNLAKRLNIQPETSFAQVIKSIPIQKSAVVDEPVLKQQSIPSVSISRYVGVISHKSRTVAVVVPAPHSSVSNLTPVVVPETSSIPGSGSGTSPSPEPSPNSAPSPGTVSGYESSNWSGYMATAGGYTAISGSWTVPAVTGNGYSVSSDAAWIGIGGVSSLDLIQAGTMDQVSPTGQASYAAFYEMLPAVSTPVIGMNVDPGDVINATINETSTNLWQISIADQTENESFSTTVAYVSSESTAEWIEEDPSNASGRQIPFDSFGSVTFSSSQAVAGGFSENLTQANVQPITMVSYRGLPVASPSSVSPDGSGFSVNSS
jgi:hypothetical protein